MKTARESAPSRGQNLGSRRSCWALETSPLVSEQTLSDSRKLRQAPDCSFDARGAYAFGPPLLNNKAPLKSRPSNVGRNALTAHLGNDPVHQRLIDVLRLDGG